MDIKAYVEAVKAIGYSGVLGIDLYKYDYKVV